MSRIFKSYEQIKGDIEIISGYKLISETYEGYQKELEILCPSGHPFKTTWNQFDQGKRCPVCFPPKTKKISLETVLNLFYEKNYTPLFKIYERSTKPLKYFCDIHYDVVQRIDYSSIRRGRGCRYCFYERVSGENSCLWKNGESQISDYLRKKLTNWKKDSIERCNYQCVLTGGRFDVVHHLYSFNKIVNETIRELGLDAINKLTNISLYTQQELKEIESKCLEIHYKHPLGICLRDDVHQLFHLIYGNTDNTEEQFLEFKIKYLNGDYKI